MQKQSKYNNIFNFGISSDNDASGMFGENFDWHENSKAANPTDKSRKMINDVDSELILENVDKTVKNKAVKLSVKINALDKTLVRVNEELELIKLLNLEKDLARRDELVRFKTFLENRLVNLKAERKKFGVFYFIAGLLGDEAYFDRLLDNMSRLKTYTMNFCNNIIIPYIKDNLISKIRLRRE